MSTFKRLLAGMAVCVLALAATSQAALVFDVRATGVASGNATISADGKLVTAATGAVVNYSVYALVTGTGAGLEGIQQCYAVLATNNGGTQVNLTHSLATPFDGTASVAGAPTNLGGDNDTDIGTSLSPTNTTTDIICYRSNSITWGSETGVSEFLLGTGTATVIALGPDTTLSFVLPTTTAFNKCPQWREDGVSKAANTAGVSISVNPGVVFTVPEPGSLSLLGVGALGLLAQRRRQR